MFETVITLREERVSTPSSVDQSPDEVHAFLSGPGPAHSGVQVKWRPIVVFSCGAFGLVPGAVHRDTLTLSLPA